MTIYCIDDGGDGSQTNTTQSASTLDWSKADTSIANLISYDAAAFTTSGNIIYFGDDHADPDKAANYTLTGPTSGTPVILISADRTQATPTFKAATGNQISSLGGAYTMTLDGSFAYHGVRIASGSTIVFGADFNEAQSAFSCIFAPAADSWIQFSNGAGFSGWRFIDCTIDLSADGTTGRTTEVFRATGPIYVHGLTFINPGYRTGSVFKPGANGRLMAQVVGSDFSGFPAATEIYDATDSYGLAGGYMANCKTASTAAVFGGTPRDGDFVCYNVGPSNDPGLVIIKNTSGDLVATQSIYRSGGGSVGSNSVSLLVTTSASCYPSQILATPWIFGSVGTGEKTFDTYITNDVADFTDAEVWLEVEYLGASGSPLFSRSSDRNTNVTTASSVQTDDTTSTWNGTGPSFTYKQKLSVTATIGETGQYRARVAVGVASIASSRYFYVDPLVTVS